jgi:phenylacetate-CoA ligase
MMWNEASETMPRERIEALQIERLRTTVGRLLRAVAPTAERLRAAGVRSENDISSLADLARLPFSHKSDLREQYPDGLFAVPMEQVVRVHASSGTRGKPTVVGYTRADLGVWSEVMARCLVMAGVRPGTVVHNAYGYGLFTGGLGIHQGAESIGATVIPMSGGFTARQILMLRDLGSQVLCCTPSYALNLAQELRAQEVDPASLRLRIGIFGAEPWTDEMRTILERELGLTALDIYGLSEIVGPGVAAECPEGRNGNHLQEDHFLPEIVDPATGTPLPPGQEGELVLTTLTKEALPLLRYRTGDISALDDEPCACGRTMVRMARVRARYDDMLILRGVNLYPSEVERILLSDGAVAPHYQLVLDRPETMDELTVLCEPTASSASIESDLDLMRRRLERTLHEQTGLRIAVRLLEPGAVPRSEGKAVRVVDRRPA